MIIDFHTHAFPDKIAKKTIDMLYDMCNRIYTPCSDGSLQGLKNNMQKFGVDLSVVQPIVTNPKQTKSINEWAATITEGNVISFGGVSPYSDDYKRDIDFVCSLGLKGLKFHVEYQDFVLDDPKMLKIYDYAFSKGLIILHHAGADPAFKAPYRSSPKQFYNIAKELRGGTLIAAHLGGHAQWDEVEKYIVGTDIYIDTSMGQKFYSQKQFLNIVKNHGANKILFGSDSPWSRADEEIESIKTLPLTEEQKQLIFYKNSQKLLNL